MTTHTTKQRPHLKASQLVTHGLGGAGEALGGVREVRERSLQRVKLRLHVVDEALVVVRQLVPRDALVPARAALVLRCAVSNSLSQTGMRVASVSHTVASAPITASVRVPYLLDLIPGLVVLHRQEVV